MKELLQALRKDLGEPTQENEVEIEWPPAEGAPASPDVAAGESGTAKFIADAIELHPDAGRNFDSKAEELLQQLISAPLDAEKAVESSVPEGERPIATELPPNAKRGHSTLFRDREGDITARLFEHEGWAVGLQGAGYQALRKLAEEMQRTQALRSMVGVDTLEQLVFDWVRARVIGAHHEPMTTAVFAQLAELVGSFEVVLPLFKVQLGEPIQIGRVTLRTLTSADFVRWEASAFGKATPALTMRLAFMAEQQRMQGYAAAVVVVRGESDRALEVALEEAEQAVGFLRLFAPAILSPRARSFCAIVGRECVESPSYLLHDAARTTLQTGRFIDTPHDTAWRLDGARISLIRAQALQGLIEALFAGAPASFAIEIRSALVLYSQCALRSTPIAKLLAILLPLESFLLRDARESITENIATRLALAIGDDFAERKRVRKVTQDVYEMRSAYLHHRKLIGGIEQIQKLREFMEYAWRFFMSLGLRVVTRYPGRLQYLSALDDRRLGASDD